MAKKKKEEKKEEKPQKEKVIENVEVEKYSISELLKNNKVVALHAVGFLNFYGLSEDFKKEFVTGEVDIKFSEEEFNEMYKRYIEREI